MAETSLEDRANLSRLKFTSRFKPRDRAFKEESVLGQCYMRLVFGQQRIRQIELSKLNPVQFGPSKIYVQHAVWL